MAVAAVSTYSYLSLRRRSRLCSCNEFGFNFDGAPASHPTIASRFVTAAWSEVCGTSPGVYFLDGFPTDVHD